MNLLPATVVTTTGNGSMDRYGQDLARLAGVDRLDVDISTGSAGRFGHPPRLSTLLGDVRLARRLREGSALLHLTHHHLARYALALDRPFVVTAHDVIRWLDLTGRAVLIHPPGGLDRWGLRRDYAAFARAAQLIAPSAAARADLVTHLGLRPERVTVVPEAIDHGLFRPAPPRPMPWPYVLVVGSEHPRKNVEVALRAFARALRQAPDLRLVKIGAAGDGEAPFRDRTLSVIAELGLERRVVLTEEVPDAELPGWYAGAVCLLMPSRYEGFGLPPLEAMACGTPAVVSTAGSLAEVTGGAAVCLDADDVDGLAGIVLRLLHDEGMRNELRARGLRRAAEFTWSRTVAETRAVYEAVAERLERRVPT